MRKLYLFHYNRSHEHALAEMIHTKAKKKNITIVEDANDADIICSVGGDGTFLQACRRTGFRNDALYVGFHEAHFGFYCDFYPDTIDHLINTLVATNMEVREYPLIQVTLNELRSFYCLNELSVRSSIIQSFVLDVHIDHSYFETFRGDGVIVCTPTGSTGYNKSVGGSVVDPRLSCMQVSEISALNNNEYRTLGSSFLLSGNRSLTLRIDQERHRHPIISMDNEAINFRACKRIDVQLASYRLQTIKLPGNSFWDKVTRHFL